MGEDQNGNTVLAAGVIFEVFDLVSGPVCQKYAGANFDLFGVVPDPLLTP